MTAANLIFVTSGNVGQLQRSHLAPMLDRWPGNATPEVRSLLLDNFARELDAPGDPDPAPLGAAAFVVLDQPTSPAAIDRLIESLHRRHVPAVILLPRPQDWQILQRQGIIFRPLQNDPASLAAMLFALGERQSAVSLLALEVQLANRCQGGIRSEMDRMHEELHLAAAIQREYTSTPVPKVAGLDIEVLFRPVNFVSGDIYNLRDLGNGRAAFFIADAVGHGVPAALLTMVLTSSLATTEPDTHGVSMPLQPADVLARLNRRMCASCFGSGRFATAVYGVVDAGRGEVTVAGAGHPMPVVLSGSNPREIETNGPLLGVFGEAEFDQVTVPLADDETLLVYTDGLDAAFPAAPSQSLTSRAKREAWIRGMASTARTRKGGMSLVLAELQSLLDCQSGSLHQPDDVTALCIAQRKAA